MLRVISGTVGGLPLHSPKGADLRPTQDRVKQAIFSSLGEWVENARVLDLYAGTGALGIEALSRGAASALFVEKQRACVKCIRDNLIRTRFEGDVIQDDVLHYLNKPTPQLFNLIFADPPYDKTEGNLDEHSLALAVRQYASEGALFIWEQFHKQKCEKPPGWELIQRKVYGDTAVAFLKAI